MMESRAETPNEPPHETRPRVLLADDSRLVRVTASKILTEKFDLILAEDGEEAWEKICSDASIQVVFTDLGMPKLDGYGLIQRIRQSENESIRNQPIIVITGAAEEEGVRRKVFELGATDFITKPFTSTEILARAEAHASYRRDREDLQKNADIDLLTGTLNQIGFTKQLLKDISFVNRHEENLAVVVFMLDDFKAIFERLGKQLTGRILKQTATMLLGAIRKEDSIGRYGAEKFAVILPMAKTEGVVILAKRLCEKIKSFKITLGEEVLSISMSAGIASARKGSHVTADALVKAAEQALANAIALGAGEVQLLKIEPRQIAEEPLIISVDALLEAISKGKKAITERQMDAVLQQLSPLIALMNDKQKQQLIKVNHTE